MRFLALLSLASGALAASSHPVVYSYSSASTVPEATSESSAIATGSEQEGGGSGSYEATTAEPSAEGEATAPGEEATAPGEQADGGNSKELLHPRFFAYSDQYGSGQGGSRSEEKDGKEEEKFTKGGGHQHRIEHDILQGHKGDKGYKEYHKYAKAQSGAHDKESHKGKYIDSKGVKGQKKVQGAHFGLQEHKEKGRKVAKFGESGEHNKGHRTKGEHNIHKKDEYLKKHEFYDEHHEGGGHEKNGGFHQLISKKKGGKKRKGKRKSSEGERKAASRKRRKKIAHVSGRKGHSKEHESEEEFLKKGQYRHTNKNRQSRFT